jgi:adenylate kinase
MNISGQNQDALNSSQSFKLRVLLLVGAPGSGKGTQGRALNALPGFFHCSCGDVFRSVDARTELSRRFNEYSRAGKLMPDGLTVDLWHAHIIDASICGKYNPATDWLVLDGIPRNAAQAQMMDSVLDVRLVFNLCCSSRQPLIDRIRRRALKENRLDDADESVINRRLDGYEAESQLLVKQYPPCKVHNLDAMWPPHLILREILGRIIASEPYVGFQYDKPSVHSALEAART